MVPLWWAFFWVLGDVAGGMGGGLMPVSWGIAASVPRLLAASTLPSAFLARGGWRWCSLGAAGLGSAAAALERQRDLRTRPAAVAPAPSAPSRRVRCRGDGVVRITGWATVRGDRWSAPTAIVGMPETTAGPSSPQARRGHGALLAGRGPPPPPGTLMAGRWELSPPDGVSVAGGFSYRDFLAARGLGWRMRGEGIVRLPDDPCAAFGTRCAAPVRRAARRALARLFPPREAEVLGAVLLGDKGPRDSLREGFTRLGLAHLFAVSGLHVGILAAFAGGLLGLLRLPPLWKTVAVTIVLWFYTALTGAAPSTVRAAAMGTILLGARPCGGAVRAETTLALVFWGTQVWAPCSLRDPGLRLSFLAVGGILVGVRVAAAVRCAGPWRALRDGLGVSLGAQAGTAAEVARGFGFISPTAPLVNLIAVPVFGAAVWCAVLGICLAWWPDAAAGPALISWALLRMLEAGASLLDAGIPTPPAIAAWGPGRLACAAAATLMILRARGWRRWSAVGLILLLPWFPRPGSDGRMRAVQFDVGQGDAAALVFPGGDVVLIDTGPPWRRGSAWERRVLPWLRRRGVERIAGVVLTHAHADHDGAATAVAAAFPVRRWWLGGRCTAPVGSDAALRHRPVPGDTLFHDGPWALLCLGDGLGVSAHDENDRSLSVGLYRSGRPCGLWTGDLEAAGEEALAARAEGPWDVFKAGHHGSRTSSTPEFLVRVRPGVVLISCGVENRHAHPSHAPFRLDGRPLPVRRTDLEGSLEVVWKGGSAPEIRGARTPP